MKMSLLAAIPLVGKLFDGVSDHFKTKQKIKQINAEGAIKLAQTRVDARIKQAASDSDSAGRLDEIALQNVGWKDEFLMIVVTIPMILVFFPPMVPHVKAGFLALESMPEYYQYMVGGVFIYVFGFKRILLKIISAFIAARFGKLPQTTTVVVKEKLKKESKKNPQVNNDLVDDDTWDD